MPLDENDQKQIEKYTARMAPALAELRKWQAAINAVHEAAGEPVPYDLTDSELPAQAGLARRKYGRAEFFTMPLATVVKKLIEDNGALSIDELHELMISGGYPFKESNADKAKDNMKISLGKNVAFGKTSTGFYTLAPGRPRAARSSAPEGAQKPETTAAEGQEAQPGASDEDRPDAPPPSP